MSDQPEATEGPEPQQSPAEGEQSGSDAQQPAPERAQSGATASGSERRRARVSPTMVVVALLLALLGFTLVWQMRSVATDPTLAAARQEDLVRILADLDSHEERLRQDISEHEETLRRLTTVGESQQEALAEAERRADELGILAGSLPAAGPGLQVEIRAGAQRLPAALLLDAVQELRGAGAEAIQLSDGRGSQVRIVGSSYFVDDAQGQTPVIRVDGALLHSPYTITAIGEPHTLQPALNIPGGVVESVDSAGGTVTVQEEPDGVQVSAVREPTALRHAQPVS